MATRRPLGWNAYSNPATGSQASAAARPRPVAGAPQVPVPGPVNYARGGDEIDPGWDERTGNPSAQPTGTYYPPETNAPPVDPSDPTGGALPNYHTGGKYAGQMGVYSFDPTNPSGKYSNNWDDMSEKYQIETILSNFDPNMGVTPELLAALNAAGINSSRLGGGPLKFTGSGDKLAINGQVADIIQGFNDPLRKQKTWGAWAPDTGGDATTSLPRLPSPSYPTGQPSYPSGPTGTPDPGPPHGDNGEHDMWSYITKILNSGGKFDDALVGRQIDSARDDTNKMRTSMMSSNRDQLAERGLLGSGEEINALTNTDLALAQQFGGDVNDIYTNEMANADNRLMQALTLGVGLSQSEAQNVIDQYNAETGRMNANTNRDLGVGRLDLDRVLGMGRLDLDRELGYGNLDLGRTGQQLDWSKFLGTLGLDRERLGRDYSNDDWQHMMDVLDRMFPGISTAQNGKV